MVCGEQLTWRRWGFIFSHFSTPQIPTPSPKDINPFMNTWNLQLSNEIHTHAKSIQLHMHDMSELLPWLSVPRCSAIGRPRLTRGRKISNSWDLDLDMDCRSGHWPTVQFLHEPLALKTTERPIPVLQWKTYKPLALPYHCMPQKNWNHSFPIWLVFS